jgi:hypothetical protein
MGIPTRGGRGQAVGPEGEYRTSNGLTELTALHSGARGYTRY